MRRFDGEAASDMLYLNGARGLCSEVGVIGENRVSVA